MSISSECGDGFIDNDYTHPIEKCFLGDISLFDITLGTDQPEIIDTQEDNNAN